MCDFASEIKQNPASSLGAFGTIMGAISNIASAGTAKTVGSHQREAAYFTAAQQDQAAQSVVAAGERSAMNEDLKAKLLASRAIAVAAANGGDATSPGVSQIVADIAGRGAYNAGVALYDAEDKARQLRLAAEGARYSGDVAEAGGQSKAAAYLFGSAGNLAQASSLFSKYGRGGPKNQNDISPTADWQVSGATGNM